MPQEQITSSRSSSSALDLESLESDDEIRRVPEFIAGSGEPTGMSYNGGDGIRAAGPSASRQRKLERNPADREHKRLKRLLRNRVSAQEARERKKAQLRNLEERVKELGMKNMGLEERLSTLQNENQMLRQVFDDACAPNRATPFAGIRKPRTQLPQRP